MTEEVKDLNQEKRTEHLSFANVLAAELAIIKWRRKVLYDQARGALNLPFSNRKSIPEAPKPLEAARTLAGADDDERLSDARRRALSSDVVGLALSGGGIRSASFAVGILQGLASLKLLRYFDVCSTVSGGGYAGAWLSTWIYREGDPLNVEKQLDSDRKVHATARRDFESSSEDPNQKRVVDEEPEPLRHLRRYSSFLNPRPGWVTTDTMTVVAIYIRNVLINLLLLLPPVLLVVLSVRLLLWFASNLGTSQGPVSVWPWVFFVGILMILLSLSANGLAVRQLRQTDRKSEHEKENSRFVKRALKWLKVGEDQFRAHKTGPLIMAYLCVLPLLIATLCISISYPGLIAPVPASPSVTLSDSLNAMNVIGHALVFAIAISVFSLLTTKIESWRKFGASFGAGATAGAAAAVTEQILRTDSTWMLVLCGPPLLLLVTVVSVASYVGLLATGARAPEREWWGRFSALLLVTALSWFGIMSAIIFGPAVLLGAPQTVVAAVTASWLGVTIGGVTAGRSSLTQGGTGGSRPLELLARVAPPIFLIGLLAIAATLVALFMDEGISRDIHRRGFGAYFQTIHATGPVAIVWRFALVTVIFVLSAWAVDVNLFSLHEMYANRLTRAFLGASRPSNEWRNRWNKRPDQRALSGAPTHASGTPRDPNPVTGFDPEDDVALCDLRIGHNKSHDQNTPRFDVYLGPHLIVNATLNLTAGQELAWRDRKAESFTLSPLYCGARSTGYAVTGPETNEQLTLGRAMAVSGAAVDPNMNYHHSPWVTGLLTLFNARLGIWIENPKRSEEDSGIPWAAQSPTFGFRLLSELLGRTHEHGKYVHISDGGHFDNLGVYELIRRRCRYIVAVDATDTSRATSDNLGVLVRLCRIDLGVRLQLDTSPLAASGPDGRSRTRVVVGRIRYDDVDHGQTPGMLVYIRSTLTGDEPSDIRQYADKHPEFPRQPTSDQSFDEDQFESYRALGDHTGRSVFEAAGRVIDEELGADPSKWWKEQDGADAAFVQIHRKAFAAIRNRWSEPPPLDTSSYSESAKAWLAMQRDLRTRPELAEFARDLYPELAALDNTPEGPRRRAEFYMVEQALEVIENAWLGLGLKDHDDAPIDRGWFNTFRRLASTPAFRLFWPLLRSEWSPEFVRFCEAQLRMQAAPVWLVPAAGRAQDIAVLGRELAREWPSLVQRRDSETLEQAGARYLSEQLHRAPTLKETTSSPGDGSPKKLPATQAAWILYAGPVEPAPEEQGFTFPLGFLAITPVEKQKHVYELALWVRPAHRSAGIGERTLRCDEVNQLRECLAEWNARVQIRYPEVSGNDVDDINRVRWLSFFSLFDYRPQEGVQLEKHSAWVLSKQFGAGNK